MNMAAKATGQGQAIQALSLISKLTPQGIMLYATKMFAEAAKTNPRLARMAEQLEGLRSQLAQAKQRLASRSILEARRPGREGNVQQRIERQLVSNPRSLWGRYTDVAVGQLAAKLLGPQRPRGVPALEAFTSRLIKQLREQLPGKPLAAAPERPAPADEAALIGEAVRNFDKYKEVWEATQRHIQEQFKDNPEALQSLDDYFGQILSRPFSEASLNPRRPPGAP